MTSGLRSTLWTHLDAFARRRVLATIGLTLAGSALGPLGAVALKMMVDRLAGGASRPIIPFIAAYVASQWITLTSAELRNLTHAAVERRVARRLSEAVFRRLLRLPLRFHLERRTGAISQALENGVQGLQIILQHLLLAVLPVVVQLATIAVVLLHFGETVCLALFIAALACCGVTFSYFSRRLHNLATGASHAQLGANASITDGILNYETIKLFAAEGATELRVNGLLTVVERQWMRFYRCYVRSGVMVASTYALFLSASLCYAAAQVSAGRMTLGNFVLVNTYLLQVLQPVEAIGFALQGLAQGLALLEGTRELMRHPEEAPSGTRRYSACGRGALEFSHVSLAYRPGSAVLSDLSFRLANGRTVAIVGPSGSGKSTIVRLLLRLLEPDSGSILLDSVPIAQWSPSSLRESIAVVPQETVLFNDTIEYNIAIGRPGCSHEEIVSAARVAQLHEFISSLPEQYATCVGERGSRLSGGERQRLAIARAALKHASIYVFDEATSSLDGESERSILRNFRALSHASSSLIIAHRLSSVVDADEILVLDTGSVVERGTHDILLRLNGRYASLWRAFQAPGSGEVRETRPDANPASTT